MSELCREQEVIAMGREFENVKTVRPLGRHQLLKAGVLIWVRPLLFCFQEAFDEISAAEWWLLYLNDNDEIIASSRWIMTWIQELIKKKSMAHSLRCNIKGATVVWTEEAAHLLQMDDEMRNIAVY
jgi:hypothetical protein